MADEFKHKDVGGSLSKTEWEATDVHTCSGEAQGDILYQDGTSWKRLVAGDDGQYLKTQGAAANPVWAVVVSPTKEFFVPITTGGDSLGDFLALGINNGPEHIVNFFVPADFSSITNAVLVCVIDGNDATANIDITSDYAASGEAYNTNSESDTSSTYDMTANQIYELDCSGILSSLAAGDYVGIQADYTPDNGEDVFAIGFRFKYT